jgi:hypothetical protein
MDEDRKKNLDEVMKQEKQRGRRPIDFEAGKRRAQTLRDMRKLLESAREEEFVAAIRAAGLRDGSPEFLEALRIWREYRP